MYSTIWEGGNLFFSYIQKALVYFSLFFFYFFNFYFLIINYSIKITKCHYLNNAKTIIIILIYYNK